MLKSKKLKIIIGALAVLGVLIASSIWVSMSLKTNTVDDFGYTKLAENNSATSTKTQIDYIIENSNAADTDDRADYDTSNYYIDIIVPTAADGANAAASLNDFLVNGGFQKYIVNNNRTISATMPDGKVVLKIRTAGELASVEASAALSDADMIYIYAESAAQYKENPISEDLYEAIRNFAFGSNKPLIMNYDLKNDGSKDDETDTDVSTASKVYEMTTVDFKNSWKRTKTTKASAWEKDTADVAGTLQTYMSSLRSTYTTYQLNNLTIPAGYASWIDYWTRTETDDTTLNVLYIYGDGADRKSEIQGLADWMVGSGKDKVFGNSVEANIPSKAVVESAVASDLTPDSLYYVRADGSKVKKYDYIFISPENYSAANDITDEVRAELNTISEATDTQTYIIFGTMKVQTSGGSGSTTPDPENLVIDTSTNFGKLIDLSITTTGYAKKNNVLVVGKAYMQTMAANPEKNPTKIAQIVTLINKSTYRNHANGGGGTSGSVSTTAYRVLELQPCYPIDLEMALSSTIQTNLSKHVGYTSGNYYTVPANVLNTTEIDNYMDENGNVKTEYYQWDLSKAKLAYALNMSVDSIELVQMSTEEFITSKADAADSYDLIYIGGNKSALKPSSSYNIYPNWQVTTNASNSSAAFSMYAHTGELSGFVGKMAGTSDYGVTVMNGNDITYDRLQSLKQYIDSGMPIVFSSEVWTAYKDAEANKYANKYIDPDSNMYQLMAYADSKKNAGSANILENWENKVLSTGTAAKEYWIMNQTTDGTDGQIQRIENPEGAYGTAAKVTVFIDTISNELYSLVYGSGTAARPKFTITTNAKEYSDKDETTKLTERNLTWTVELVNPIEGHVYKGILLTDKDDNAEFDVATEKLGDEVTFSGGTAEFSYTYPSSEFGAFSWKILVADVTDTADQSMTDAPSRGYSAISAIARGEDQSKKEASILEIMPMKTDQVGAQDGQDGHTLYLDSNYQQARGSQFLYSEAFNDDGTVNKSAEYGYAPTPKSGGSEKNYYDTKDINFTKDGNAYNAKVYLGKYQTTLGLNRYDSDVNHEDWTYNYVDTIADDFDLSLDIMYMEDIEYYAKAARSTSEADKARYATYAEEAKELYDAYNTEGTVEYKALNEAETDLRNALLTLQQGGSLTVTNTMKKPGTNQPDTFTYTADKYNLYDLDGILDSREYFRFFYVNATLGGAGEWSAPPAYGFYTEYYKPYITENDKKIDAYRKYRHFSLMAYGPEEYLRQNYDVVVIGFYDDFMHGFTDFSDNACEDLTNFLDKNGSLLMTHDNMTKFANDTKYSVNLTNTLRSYAGMERFGEITVATGTESSVLPKYQTTDKDRYFFSSLSSGLDGVDISKNSTASGSAWNAQVSKWLSQRGNNLQKIGYPGYTDAFVIYETNQAQTMPYTFAEFQIENQIKYNLSYGPLDITGTTKATQVNRGVVTTYPFYVVSDLRISPTHNQAYSLNLEDDQVTVWYTFAADSQSGTGTSGGSDYKTLKENSSLYAASPKDGMDSYFIYSVGNITYCGAGHAMVTGDQRDNNDERKLFLNVLVNMAKKSGKVAEQEKDIILYDPDGTTRAPGNVVKRDAENGYYINVSSGVDYPEFGFGMDMLTTDKVTDVQIFYDLDYNAENGDANDVYEESDKHVLVPTTEDTIQKLNAGEVYKVNKVTAPALVTQRSYFDAYDGTYTYLVVRATIEDNMGTKHIVTKRIKIKLTRELLNLT